MHAEGSFRPVQRIAEEGLAERKSFSPAQWQKAIAQVMSNNDPAHVAEAVAIINRIEGLALDVPKPAPLHQKNALTTGADPIQRVIWPAMGRPAGARDDVDPVTMEHPMPGDDVVVLSCGHVYQQTSLAGLITSGRTHCLLLDGGSLTAGWMHAPAVMNPALTMALAGPVPVPVPVPVLVPVHGPAAAGGLDQVAEVVGTGIQVIAAIVAIYFVIYGGTLGRALALAALATYFNMR
jgi:hypothetical protein